MKIFKISSLLLAPNIIFAFSLAESTLKTTIGYVMSMIYIIIPILSGLAFIFFFWGLSQSILNSDKPEEIKKSRSKMLWGILALFILLTFRTIIGLIATELEIRNFNPTSGIPSKFLPTNATTPNN